MANLKPSSVPGRTGSISSFLPASNLSHVKPVVVGLYGIPGSGKTFLLNQLKQELDPDVFVFYEGSEVIGSIVEGGLDAFKKLEEHKKKSWRKEAIETIRNASAGRVAVVTGHYMFWSENEKSGSAVLTDADWDTYTHILYLDLPIKEIKRRRQEDLKRVRPQVAIEHLRKWQQKEKEELRQLCLDHWVLFMAVSEPSMLVARVSTLLLDFGRHNVDHNTLQATGRLGKVLSPRSQKHSPVLLLDADRTLAPVDTGELFWKKVRSSEDWTDHSFGLKEIFSSQLDYSYTAFRQAMLLYEEAAEKLDFDYFCQKTASEVQMYPEFISLLQVVAEHEGIDAVIVTCGLSRVWDIVLEREHLSKSIKVIGGGRLADGFVVSPQIKQALAASLRYEPRHRTVWAFGDSPVDLDMMCTAQNPIVVVADEQLRSKTMEKVLGSAIERGDLDRARQAVLPGDATPRLDTERLPLVQLTASAFVDSILSQGGRHADSEVIYATDKPSTKVLATTMRDSSVAGPDLRRAHRRAGEYLAIEFLTGMLGIEKCQIRHVLGRTTMGYRLLHEQQTLIVALMRGGEPMAYGVNEVFPLAMLLHAHRPEDIKAHHIKGMINVILVDSVVNTGKSVIEFLQYLRSMHATVRIVIVAGVLQAQAMRDGKLAEEFQRHYNIKLVALRTSETSFVGSGTNDTGNRLFNTTHLA